MDDLLKLEELCEQRRAQYQQDGQNDEDATTSTSQTDLDLATELIENELQSAICTTCGRSSFTSPCRHCREQNHQDGTTTTVGVDASVNNNEDLAMERQSATCSNCGRSSFESPCQHCREMRHCRHCNRHLPNHCFQSDQCNMCTACIKKSISKSTVSTRDEIISQINIPTDPSDVSFETFATRNVRVIDDVISDQLRRHRSFRVQLHVDAIMSRELVDGDTVRVPGYFITSPQLINSSTSFAIQAAVADLNHQIENFNERGSGFVIERILKVMLTITKYRPLAGSTFIPTPKVIASKHCVINVQNEDDKCFAWAILAGLYPAKNKCAHRVSSYRKYMDVLNLHGLKFPLRTKDVAKFEAQNPCISVNVLYYDRDDRSGEFVVEYMSPHKNRPKHVNLLLLDCQTGFLSPIL